MTRTAGSSGPTTLQAIRRIGLGLIYEHGYEAMTLRMLANGVGIKQGSLYNHFRNKQELLFDLVHDHMVGLTGELDARLAGTTTPLERLDAFVAFHVTAHMERKKEVFVGNSELRALTPENLETILGLRFEYEKRLTDILRAGIEAGSFELKDARITTFAVLAMLTGVCSWYREGGRLTKTEIVADYLEMVRGALNAG